MKDLVVIYAYNDWDCSGVLGIYKDWKTAFGDIFSQINEIGEALPHNEFTTTITSMDGYGEYFDIEVTYTDKGDKPKDLYRVYFYDKNK